MGRAPEPAGFVGFRCTEIRGSKCPWSEFCGRVTRASPDEPSMARRGFLLCRIRVSKGDFKFSDWQIAQSRVCFVPMSENKKI